MKQFTTPEQTAKLIELGLLPKHIQEISDDGKLLLECMGYSIGELIEMLPIRINDYTLFIYTNWDGWIVDYNPDISVKTKFYCVEIELIDALYDMIVKLKEEEVI